MHLPKDWSWSRTEWHAEPGIHSYLSAWLYLFIAAFTLLLLYLLWHYLLAAVVLYAIIKAFTSNQHDHGNRRRCRRRDGPLL